MLHVLIIEDEPFAQNEMQRLLQNTGKEFSVINCLESVEDSIAWFNTNEAPDVVFCDIQLADGLSFDIFKQIKVKAPVIFTTAYDTYAIEAFKVNSIDYLLKPIEQNALNSALDKLEALKVQFSGKEQLLSNTQLENLLALVKMPQPFKSRMLVKIGDQYKFIPVTKVAYFYAEDNEVLLMTNEKKRYVIDYSIEQLVSMLDPMLFYRLNRSFLCHKNAIIKVHRYFNSRLKIDLQPDADSEVLVSRVKVAEFLNWMER
ncbi:MAG: DNA-binding response regulator [Bacteroidetes bacterium HGW-Bacteroidetes-4]|jgi:DNA-binding LytR/AlgR family response regulator|nr:MAG: DNA-binding response regulator [Bacteroidetes bacterium HGW-Bacteroidetes-4]